MNSAGAYIGHDNIELRTNPASTRRPAAESTQVGLSLRTVMPSKGERATER